MAEKPIKRHGIFTIHEWVLAGLMICIWPAISLLYFFNVEYSVPAPAVSHILMSVIAGMILSAGLGLFYIACFGLMQQLRRG